MYTLKEIPPSLCRYPVLQHDPHNSQHKTNSNTERRGGSLLNSRAACVRLDASVTVAVVVSIHAGNGTARAVDV